MESINIYSAKEIVCGLAVHVCVCVLCSVPLSVVLGSLAIDHLK